MKLSQLSKGIFGGSIVLLITINLFNGVNYFFHFVMARMLDPANYGTLVVLMSMLYMLNFSSESIQTILAKYTSHETSMGKVKNVLKRALKKSFKISIIIFFLYAVVAVFLSKFLRIEYPLLLFAGLAIFSIFLLPVGRGVLQGKKRFSTLGWNMVIEAVIKLIVAIILVYFGWKVYGAILGVFLGAVVAFVFTFYSLKDVLSLKEESTDTQKVYQYGIPVFVVMFAILAFFSLDVILAKAFFSDDLAGQYAIASTLSKIIFFGTLPISKAMFPISSEASKKNKDSKNILIKSLLILGAGVIMALLVMAFFPELMVKIFSGTVHPGSVRILFFLSISTALISFTNLILLYKLSIGNIKNYWSLLIFLVFEVALLSLFHSSLVEFSITLIFLNLLFLFGSIFLYNKRQ